MITTQALLLSNLPLLVDSNAISLHLLSPPWSYAWSPVVGSNAFSLHLLNRSSYLSEVSRWTISYREFYPVWKEDVPFNILKTRPTHTKITARRCTLRLPGFNISIPEKKSFSLERQSYFVVYDVPFCCLILVSSK